MVNRILLFSLLLLQSAAAQEFRRWEVGAQLARLDIDSIGEGPLGGGGRISYFVHQFVAVEAEANRYFEDPSGNFGHTQLLAGARAGTWIGPLGLFAKARSGLVRLGGGTAERNTERENNIAMDVGGVILVGRGRAGMRIDAGDTIIFIGPEPFRTALPRAITNHNRQLSVGFVIRF